MLVVMNIAYFFTNGAAGVFLVAKVHLVDEGGGGLWTTMHKFMDVIACINNSTNWAFYLLSGKQFRDKLWLLFRCSRLCKNKLDGSIQSGCSGVTGPQLQKTMTPDLPLTKPAMQAGSIWLER